MKIMPRDALGTIAVTNQDLSPDQYGGWVFGQACPEAKAGVFSFARYDPAFEGIEDPNREFNWFMRST